MKSPEDRFQWLDEQATLLQQGKLNEIDATNLEVFLIQEMANEEASVLGALRQLLAHLLKATYQPARHSRSWDNTIIEHRARIEDLVGDKGVLRMRLPDFIARAYRNARQMAAAQTGLELDTFPVDCPFTQEEVMDDDFFGKPQK